MNDYSQCPAEGAIGLLALLIRRGRDAEARLDDALESVELSFVKWRVLDMLVKTGTPVSLKCLPTQLGCVKSNVTQLVDKLETEAMVRRIADAQDRRGTQIALTDAGSDAHRKGRIALEAATQAAFADASSDDQETLRHLLTGLPQLRAE